jgi:hypothetical protein
MLSWVHFGDLHASNDDDFESLAHLKSMVRLVNSRLADRIDFAYLPGDNANNGTSTQFERIVEALCGLRWVIYAATRSTGQVEEDNGRPGFSVAAIDDGVVSWKFQPPDADWPFFTITQPADRRLARERASANDTPPSARSVRVLVSNDDIVAVTAHQGGIPISLERSLDGPGIWQAALPDFSSGETVRLNVVARTAGGGGGRGHHRDARIERQRAFDKANSTAGHRRPCDRCVARAWNRRFAAWAQQDRACLVSGP